MARQKRIQYAIDKENGLVYSRIESEIAIPILDFKEMTPENNWKMGYNLEKCNVIELVQSGWSNLIWTRKIPIAIKNVHRVYWGMKPLKVKP